MLKEVIRKFEDIFNRKINERKKKFSYDDPEIKFLVDAISLLERAERMPESPERDHLICIALRKAEEVNAFEEEKNTKKR